MEEEIASEQAGDPAQSGSASNVAEATTDRLSQAVSRYRDIVASMPGLVPEMVQGATIDEVDASAEAARQAYEEVMRRVTAIHENQVPPGNPARSQSETHLANLKPEAKIALGLRGK
jgi:hypothetical protein